MNSIEHNTEQMITEVQPINSARVDFAKMFAIGTSSGCFITEKCKICDTKELSCSVGKTIVTKLP